MQVVVSRLARIGQEKEEGGASSIRFGIDDDESLDVIRRLIQACPDSVNEKVRDGLLFHRLCTLADIASFDLIQCVFQD
jgi:hypothetical protein